MDNAVLTVSDNGRYLLRAGKPFFWFADTGWNMFLRMSEEEIDVYLRNRLEKGVNVIQSVLIYQVDLSRRASLPPAKRDTSKEEYWQFVDHILDRMDRLGLYAGLLPVWGSNVKNGSMDMEKMEAYAHFLGRRFQSRNNIIWILGGDVRGDVGEDIFKREGEILKQFNPERLMTYHPFGRTSSSMWFHECEWLDFNMFQSGHRRYDQAQLGEWDDNLAKEEFFGEDNWRYVLRDHAKTPVKPTIDGEPSYEAIIQGLHNPKNPYWEEWDARRYAYWSVFAGAAGHTYGNNAVMQARTSPDDPAAYSVRELMSDAIHHPGIAQIGHLKHLMEQVDFIHGVPRDDLLLYGQKERHHRIAVFAGADYIFCYDYSGDDFMLDLSAYAEKTMSVYWMDPRDGVLSYAGRVKGETRHVFSPAIRREKANDWVLVLKEETGND